MKTLISQQTKLTPHVELDDATLTIIGNCITMEPELFWSLLIHQIKQHTNIQHINIELNHVGSSSIPYLIKLIKTVSTATVTWICDEQDDDMIELGQNLNFLIGNEFSFNC